VMSEKKREKKKLRLGYRKPEALIIEPPCGRRKC